MPKIIAKFNCCLRYFISHFYTNTMFSACLSVVLTGLNIFFQWRMAAQHSFQTATSPVNRKCWTHLLAPRLLKWKATCGTFPTPSWPPWPQPIRPISLLCATAWTVETEFGISPVQVVSGGPEFCVQRPASRCPGVQVASTCHGCCAILAPRVW